MAVTGSVVEELVAVLVAVTVKKHPLMANSNECIAPHRYKA